MFFLPCELRRLVVFVLFGSKNDNNNSFDMVGLNSFFMIMGVLCFSFLFYLCLALLFLVAGLILDEVFAY